MSDSKSLSQARYSNYAQGYVTSQTHAKGADLERLLALAQPQPDWVVLDVATGGGHTALKFAPHVAQVIASDLTPKMLEAAAAHLAEKGAGNVSFQQADAEALPFEDSRFDLVTCRIAPHHFPDAAQFVREAARVLKPGGLLLVQDHVLPEDADSAAYVDAFERLRDPSHHRAFSAAEWAAMFTAAGLQVEHTEQITKRHDFLSWAERQGNDAATIAQLVQMMLDAPPIANAWMQPQAWGTPEASFSNQHLIILGRKPTLAQP